jgi:hypothetical protein
MFNLDSSILLFNRQTLIAVEQNAPQWVQKNIDNSQQEYRNNQGRDSDEINGPSSAQHPQTAGIMQLNDTGNQEPNRGGCSHP